MPRIKTIIPHIIHNGVVSATREATEHTTDIYTRNPVLGSTYDAIWVTTDAATLTPIGRSVWDATQEGTNNDHR